MKRLAAVLVAILAALVWAPSAVLGAAPNRLSDAAVTPTTATTLTPVIVSVHYLSTAGNPATGVFASIGPLEVALARTGGTAVDGTWSAITLAPPGTWRVGFRATVTQGPQPALDGPLLTVTAPSPTPAAGSLNPAPPVERSMAPSMDGGGASATASPAPAAAPGGSGGAPGPAASPTPDSAPGDASPGGGEQPAAPASSQPPPADGSQHPGRAQRPSGPGDATPAPAGLPEDFDGTAAGTDLVMLLAMVLGAAAAALLGTGWLVMGRDRGDEEQLATATGQMPARAARRSVTAADLAEDPVIAAMLADEKPRHGRLGPGPWAERPGTEATRTAPRRPRGRRG